MRSRWPDFAALSFLLSLPLALLAREIVLGGTILDYDIELMSVPAYSWFSEQLKQGTLPLWSPEVMGGAPLAFAIYGFLYPPDIFLSWLLDGSRAFHISLALHVFMAGACTYWYCRVVGMRRLPALLAAVLFQMGNQVLTWQSNGFITRTLFLLPALLATTELMFRRNPRYWLLVPVMVGAALLGGYAQVVLIALVADAAYALMVATLFHRSLGTRKAVSLLLLLGLGVALGFGLAAVRVGPTYALADQSTRSGGMDFGRSAVDSIEPATLMSGSLLPALLELPPGTVNRPDYVGIPGLLLAAMALWAITRMGRVGRYHAALAVVATLLSLGMFTPFYGMLLSLPFFSLFRGPDRFSPMAGFGIAILAACALEMRLPRAISHSRRWQVAAVAIASTMAIIAVAGLAISVSYQFGQDPVSVGFRRVADEEGWGVLNVLRARVAVALFSPIACLVLLAMYARQRLTFRNLELSLLALSSVTLFVLGWAQNQWLPPSALSNPPALVKWLQADDDRFRVFAWSARFRAYDVKMILEANGLPDASGDAEERYLRQFIPPNLGMLYGISTIEWYDALQSRRQALVAKYAGSERAETARYSDGDWVDWNLNNLGLQDRLNLLAALNVKYLTTAFPIDDSRLEWVAEASLRADPRLDLTPRVQLYRLKNAMPRAYVVPEGLVMGREEDVLRALMTGTVDLREKVLLEQQSEPLAGPALSASGSRVDIVDYRNERVSLRAHTDGSGFLVLMDFLLPGWTARVDGKAEPILAGNFAGRAVPLDDAGDHYVEFTYQPPLFREGAMVSLFSLALLTSVSVVWGYRARRSSLLRLQRRPVR